jgi:hypothetical protein
VSLKETNCPIESRELLTGLVEKGGFGVPMNPSTSSVSIKEALLNFVFILLVAIVALSYLIPLPLFLRLAGGPGFVIPHCRY